VDGKSAHGGYCGPAVKPIALHMVQQIAGDAESALPVSGIGGISDWRDAAEFLLLGCQSVQLCTAPMHYGFRIVEDMIDGLSNWMDEKGFRTIDDFRGRSLPNVTEWKHLNLNYKIIARISHDKCIGCDLCYIACWDGAHQCIHIEGFKNPEDLLKASRSRITLTPVEKHEMAGLNATPPIRIPRVDEDECVGCNLCWLVCPVEDCITMERVDSGVPSQSWEQRTGAPKC
jgi:dihydropyrimidine dehydrogenase (NAD+) subunit PreA